jgi:hypothetical protein
MSLNRPAPNPPYPYYPSGIVRAMGKTKKIKGRRGKRRGVKGMFSRERQAEQAFKYGQIRSGLEGLATFRGRQRVPREQVVSDFFRIHQQALRNRARDEVETQRRLLIKDDERKTSAEQRAVIELRRQAQTQQENIRLQRATLQNQARLQQGMLDLADRFMRSQDERERRQGEFQERLLGLQKVGGQSDNREVLEGLRSIHQTLQEGFDLDEESQQATRDKIYSSLVRATLGKKPPPPPEPLTEGGSPRFVEITTPTTETPPLSRQNPLNQTLEPTSTIPYHRPPPPEGAKPQNRVMKSPPNLPTREQLAQATPSVPFVGRTDAPKQSMADYVAQQMARQHDGGLQLSHNETREIQKAREQTAPQSADNQPSGIVPFSQQELAEIREITEQPTERPTATSTPRTPPPPQELGESVEASVEVPQPQPEVLEEVAPRTAQGNLALILEDEEAEDEPIAEPELEPQLSQSEVRRLQDLYAKEVENNKRVQEQFVKATEQFKAGKMPKETYDAIGRAHSLQAKEVSKLHEKLEFQKFVISPFYQPSREEEDAGFVAGGGTPISRVRVGGDGQRPLPPIIVQEKKAGAPPTPPATPPKTATPPPQQFDVSVEATGGGSVPKAVLDEAQRRHDYEVRTTARLQYFNQLQGLAKGNRKRSFQDPNLTQFPALEILEDFDNQNWTNSAGRKAGNAPTKKGVYRFANVGSRQGGARNTRASNLYPNPEGKIGAKGDKWWGINFHNDVEHYEDLIRRGKIRFKDVDIGQ